MNEDPMALEHQELQEPEMLHSSGSAEGRMSEFAHFTHSPGHTSPSLAPLLRSPTAAQWQTDAG
jgi:hypothetical protein